jgi:hypothetical protein
MEPGGLAVQCPACPHSGINLPENWEQVDVSLKLIFNVSISICNLCWQIRFLYALFLTLDTNFHLKNCLQSSEAGDPGFHMGLAYFVPNGPHNAHILDNAS